MQDTMQQQARQIACHLINLDIFDVVCLDYDVLAAELLALHGAQYSKCVTALVIELIESCRSLAWAERAFRVIAELMRLLLAQTEHAEQSAVTMLWRLLGVLTGSGGLSRAPFFIYLCQRTTTQRDVHEMAMALQRNEHLRLLFVITLSTDSNASLALESLQRVLSTGVSSVTSPTALVILRALLLHSWPSEKAAEEEEEILVSELLDCVNLPSALEVALANNRDPHQLTVEEFVAAVSTVVLPGAPPARTPPPLPPLPVAHIAAMS